jgi:magnesium transporter
MSKKNRFKLSNKNIGTSPGTLTYVGDEVKVATNITLIEYNDDFEKVKKITNLHDCKTSSPSQQITWLNVDGIHEVNVIETIGQRYDLHPLIMEDILNTQQKPKFEYFDADKLLYTTFKMLEYNPYTREVGIEHISLVLGDSYLLSFQEEKQRDIFETVLERIQKSVGKTRKNGADYLFYSLMDSVVDNYFLVLEKLADQLEKLEEEVINTPKQKNVNELYNLKRELTLMRKHVWPLREMMSMLIREESPLISANTSLYLRDVYDHVTQVLETIDSYRELIASLLDLYLSSVSNKMNNVMKVLTVISVIFMPLTFVAGIYGMNFDNMPELHWRYGYYFVWGIMITLVIAMLFYFKKKDWL